MLKQVVMGLLFASLVSGAACKRRDSDEEGSAADSGTTAVPTTVAPAVQPDVPPAPMPTPPPTNALDADAGLPAVPAQPVPLAPGSQPVPVAPGAAPAAPTAPAAPMAPAAPTAPTNPSAPTAARPTAPRPTAPTAPAANNGAIVIPGIGGNDAVRVQRQGDRTNINVGGIQIAVPHTQNNTGAGN
ncbi:MAG: hypothetical protein JNK72_04265 [Myxococcales bacterium]|nr:hypothetical protein [Myxococcales bacterium]